MYSIQQTYNDKKDNIRTGNVEIFLEIAIDNYLLAEKYIPEIIELYPNGINHMDRLFFIANEKSKHEIQGILSLCIFFEAVINEVGQVNLGNRFFGDNIDNMKLISKWKTVPRLAYGKSLIESKVYFENLNKLIVARNKLAHYKTKIIDENVKRSETEDLFNVLKNNLYTLDEILKDLDSLDTVEIRDYRDYADQLKRIKIQDKNPL